MKKILFIEDEQALQRAATQALHDAGFEVLSALDGEIGLRIAKNEHPDLILLDLILPRKDGFAVLKELKEDAETRHIPVIALSNLMEESAVEKTVELGAATYLVKTNYQLDEIVEKVKRILGE